MCLHFILAGYQKNRSLRDAITERAVCTRHLGVFTGWDTIDTTRAVVNISAAFINNKYTIYT